MVSEVSSTLPFSDRKNALHTGKKRWEDIIKNNFLNINFLNILDEFNLS
jgi:hypothetical protein